MSSIPPWLQESATELGLQHCGAYAVPHLLSTRSVLLPTRTTMTSLPRSVRTSSIHRAVFRKDCRSTGHHLLWDMMPNWLPGFDSISKAANAATLRVWPVLQAMLT